LKELLIADVDYTPCPVASGDELFPNGLFVFNVTKINEYIQENLDDVMLEDVAVNDFPKNFSSINESHVDLADISKPVVLAEISPGRYSLIDGNHRMERARRMGLASVQAYKVNVAQHIRFLTTNRAYLAYIEYWNQKVRATGENGSRAKGRRTRTP